MKVFVVGNGPSALTNSLGEVIDKFECVVRLNLFRLIPEYTGSKISVIALNEGIKPTQMTALPVDYYLLAVPWTKYTEPCLWSRLFYGLNSPMVSEDVAREATDRFKGTSYWASTGIITLAHFIGLGHSVWHSGFDHFASERHHYADDNVPFCGHHSPHMEAHWMHDLYKTGRLFHA